jgi:hypothetical protein
MSEVIVTNDNAVEQAPQKREFYIYGDDAGINEIRFANDVPFVLNNFMAVGDFIRRNLRDSDGKLPTLPTFLRDLADMAEATNSGMDTEPPPEAEVQAVPLSEQLN